ncbi:MAG: ChbG/HpnK family deacetylase [Gemmataceae bacterium]
MPRPHRELLVVADDYGIGPATSQGILDLAGMGALSATVLMVNTPYAEADIEKWHRANQPLAMGWHPNLTLDRPMLPPDQVPSLVDEAGQFHKLGAFVKKAMLGRLNPAELEAELAAQLDRFVELVGQSPDLVNSHQHTCIFGAAGPALLRVLERQRMRPYIRRIRDSWSTLWKVPGARLKRLFVSRFARKQNNRQRDAGFPGNEGFAGITDPKWVQDPQFFARWLRHVPGQLVELMCHPGYEDETLTTRDSEGDPALVQRRVDELQLLHQPAFFKAIEKAGFSLVAPERFRMRERAYAHAA